MKKESFDSMDESLRRRLDAVPRKAVPPELLKGFSASVAARLEAEGTRPARRRFAVPALAPAFAVLVLAVVVVGRLGPAARGPAPRPPYVQIASNPSNLSSEIAALRELGAWTEEDEQSVGITDDAALEELEFSGLSPSGTSEYA
ncbi:MAG TPA: hypothetical protein VL404_02870 [Candidatus Eisenbacteria bacterium]|nr:hypothetical protein [Candidatus Eisenbacteria bacterium]